jgi:hypothetical protein
MTWAFPSAAEAAAALAAPAAPHVADPVLEALPGLVERHAVAPAGAGDIPPDDAIGLRATYALVTARRP